MLFCLCDVPSANRTHTHKNKHMRMCAHTHSDTLARSLTHKNKHMRVRAHTHSGTLARSLTHTHTHTHTQKQTHACARTHALWHTRSLAHTHTHTHRISNMTMNSDIAHFHWSVIIPFVSLKYLIFWMWLSQQRLWRILSCGMWCHLAQKNFTKGLEECTASIFRVNK
jgi:hypothetical protein